MSANRDTDVRSDRYIKMTIDACIHMEQVTSPLTNEQVAQTLGEIKFLRSLIDHAESYYLDAQGEKETG